MSSECYGRLGGRGGRGCSLPISSAPGSDQVVTWVVTR